jgi:hypothetical protein
MDIGYLTAGKKDNTLTRLQATPKIVVMMKRPAQAPVTKKRW